MALLSFAETLSFARLRTSVGRFWNGAHAVTLFVNRVNI